jgi:hypothetical protein
MHTFRFDDISVNTDLERLGALIDVIVAHEPNANVLLAISPIVFCPTIQLSIGHEQRVHPPTLTAMSALHPYYKGTRCGIPVLPFHKQIVRAGHGLAHVDHRLLDYQAQEMSIVMSCALAKASVFVPPYNHWDKNTEKICDEHSLDLIQFEDGWLHALYNSYDDSHHLYYMHPYDMTACRLKAWFEA